MGTNAIAPILADIAKAITGSHAVSCRYALAAVCTLAVGLLLILVKRKQNKPQPAQAR